MSLSRNATATQRVDYANPLSATRDVKYTLPIDTSANGTVSAVTATFSQMSSNELFEFIDLTTRMTSPVGSSWADIKKKYGL